MSTNERPPLTPDEQERMRELVLTIFFLRPNDLAARSWAESLAPEDRALLVRWWNDSMAEVIQFFNNLRAAYPGLDAFIAAYSRQEAQVRRRPAQVFLRSRRSRPGNNGETSYE